MRDAIIGIGVTMNRRELARWVEEALANSGVSRADVAREFLNRGLINTEDRSVAGKIVSGKRDLKATEMFLISEMTGHPIPTPKAGSDVSQLIPAIRSAPKPVQDQIISAIKFLLKIP